VFLELDRMGRKHRNECSVLEVLCTDEGRLLHVPLWQCGHSAPSAPVVVHLPVPGKRTEMESVEKSFPVL